MSRTKAINDYCKGCIYDQKAPGTWREQVEACTSEGRCALWPYRPVSVSTVNGNRKGKIAEGLDIDALVDGLDHDDVANDVVEDKVAA